MANPLKGLIDLPTAEKQKRGILHTPSEIQGQVELWGDTCRRLGKKEAEIRSFMNGFVNQDGAVAVLSGAGTSEFIGYCVESLFRKNLRIPTNVFPTTRIVTNPWDTIMEGRPTLLVSFARSGNSPESIGALRIANTVSDRINHLVITCNAEGDLARTARGMKNSLLLTLGEGTNDRGLAMTSSFSNMVVASHMLSFYRSFDQYLSTVERIIRAGRNMLEKAPQTMDEVCSLDFTRAVFLGNGANYGTAVESHLKLQELTSGRVMCAFDTFLGLRHGPEAVIDDQTLVVAYLSSDPYVRRYEEDLLLEIKEKKLGMTVVVCSSNINKNIRGVADFTVEFDPGETLQLQDDLTPPVFIIAGQLLGLFKSLKLGLKPDSPSETGVIHRVVEGVKIYDPVAFRERGIFRVIAER